MVGICRHIHIVIHHHSKATGWQSSPLVLVKIHLKTNGWKAFDGWKMISRFGSENMIPKEFRDSLRSSIVTANDSTAWYTGIYIQFSRQDVVINF
ncbi:hypothetical protein CDAR_381471 [Caerostris darwini]|uniref:Uncharacterized protein n=1 Tax=Caerostris darwini TaxID=1538125 RepID=A0AAV4UMG8_9ARAC|nr:hypothetical protein CDAR_381471 [Caerostris darwini]